jgi:Protein of unknown function (DUF1579)
MEGNQDSQTPGLPQPDPALERLEPLVGRWRFTGRTLDSEEDNISGYTMFKWLPGAFFLQQRIELDFMGLPIRSTELIGYDPSTGAFSSSVYSNLAGAPIPYTWDLRDGVLTISMPVMANFRGKFAENGNSFSGGWRPEPGQEGPGNVPYDVTGTRAE